MAVWEKLKFWGKAELQPVHLRYGSLGEEAAQNFLKKKGLKFLTANFSTKRGEIDLIFRDCNCLVFVEVKTRSSETWSRPERAVNSRKSRALMRAAQDYLRLLKTTEVAWRFDIVEVLLEAGAVREVRHLENTVLRRRR